MSVSPDPVNARDIAGFLSEVLDRLGGAAPATAADDVAFFSRKADLLGRIAAQSQDPDLHDIADNARRQLAAARARLAGGGL